jgi:uncharacterized protein with von Willebrand factor type A (vWA) domain
VREAVALTARLSLLVGSMRAGGVRVGLGELIAAHRALSAVDATDRRASYLAARAALCARRADLEVFDAAWEEVFGPEPGSPAMELLREQGATILPKAPGAAVAGDVPVPAPAEEELDVVPAAWSAVELLKHKDFAQYTDAERAAARRLLARLGRHGPLRRSRRTKRARGRGPHADHRATMRASLRYGGEPVDRRFRESTLRPRPLVLVVDVSGSMEPYARMLLQYAQACVAGRRRVEVFAFGTRLTRITRELAGRDPDAALARASEAVTDWHGGTRIGACVAELNRTHGRRLGRGATVVLLSDGWDRGDPDELAAELGRLRRCAHELIWLNPLKARAGYEPLTRGMQAALPHLDGFMAGNSISSLEELARRLEQAPDRHRGGEHA